MIICGIGIAATPDARASAAPSGSDSNIAKASIVSIYKVLSFAEKFLGTPYRYGGKGPGGFDCSGFVSYCFRQTMGLNLPPMATVYNKVGTAVSKDSARPGDIICFEGSRAGTKTIGHVGIVTEVTSKSIWFIHAAMSGIRYDTLGLTYYKTRYMGIRRVIP